MKFPRMTPEDQKANPSLPVDPWDEVDFAAEVARNTFHQVVRAHLDSGNLEAAHALAVQYGKLMTQVWLCEIAEPIRVHVINVLDRLGILEESDTGAGGPPGGK